MYQEKCLHAIFTAEIPLLYPIDFHRAKLHLDRKTRHTSKIISAFLEKIKIVESIEYTPFQHIPSNFPDISLMNYSIFGQLE